MVEAAQSLGAGPLWILRPLTLACANVNTLGMLGCCSPLKRCPTPVTRAGAPGLPGPWGFPEIDSGNGAPTCSRPLTALPTRPSLVDGALSPGLANVLCWYWGFFVPGEGLEAWVSGAMGAREADVQQSRKQMLSQLAFHLAFSNLVAIASSNFSEKKHWL